MLVGDDAARLADRFESGIVLMVEGNHSSRHLPLAGRNAFLCTLARRRVLGLSVALVAFKERLESEVDVHETKLLHLSRHCVHGEPVAPAAHSKSVCRHEFSSCFIGRASCGQRGRGRRPDEFSAVHVCCLSVYFILTGAPDFAEA